MVELDLIAFGDIRTCRLLSNPLLFVCHDIGVAQLTQFGLDESGVTFGPTSDLSVGVPVT